VDPDKYRQLGRLGIKTVVCKCFLARAHDEKVQALKLILAVVGVW
jgi:hypothetical protein